MTDDLDAEEILALRVWGVSKVEIAARLGCSLGRVDAVLAASAERTLLPENVRRMLIDGVGRLGELERICAAKAEAGDAEAAKLLKQLRRQRARHAKLVLERAPVSRPV